MIRKFHEAKLSSSKEVVLWGSGSPRREFLHVDDLANGVVYALESSLKEPLYNIGSGSEISIKDLAKLIQGIIGYHGDINWDSSKPDGTPKKLMDSSRFNALGWSAKIDLAKGVSEVYKLQF
jgi:GDP-L-fucose synthase